MLCVFIAREECDRRRPRPRRCADWPRLGARNGRGNASNMAAAADTALSDRVRVRAAVLACAALSFEYGIPEHLVYTLTNWQLLETARPGPRLRPGSNALYYNIITTHLYRYNVCFFLFSCVIRVSRFFLRFSVIDITRFTTLFLFCITSCIYLY